MNRILTLAIVAAALVVTSAAADAGHRGWRSDGWRRSFSAHNRFAPRRHLPVDHCYPYASPYTSPYAQRLPYGFSRFGHRDYHPGEYVRHGNHFDYVPGHWH